MTEFTFQNKIHCQVVIIYQLVSFFIRVSVGLSTISNQTTITSALLDTLCSQITCTNGECYTSGNVPMCTCNELYTGTQCDVVNLSKVDFIVIGSMVIFKWPKPPLMRQYSFIYYRINDPLMEIYARNIIIGDHEASALVGNLRDGVTEYRICIEKQAVAEHAVLTQSMEHVTNCVTVSTSPDYHTVFAWFLTACGCIVAALLIYWQRDKIELLYFNRAITVNNGIYNYNVAELIRLENERKQQETEYQLIHKTEEGLPARLDKGALNRLTLETIADEN